MLDGLIKTVEGEVGLAEVVVGEDESEIGLAVIEHEQLIEGQLLDLDVDAFLAVLGSGRSGQVVELADDVPRDLLCVGAAVPW
jgi:hypothetical protein